MLAHGGRLKMQARCRKSQARRPPRSSDHAASAVARLLPEGVFASSAATMPMASMMSSTVTARLAVPAIDGLYAAGNTTASVMGRTYPGPGSTIAPAVVFGYRAARHAATSRAAALLPDGATAAADES